MTTTTKGGPPASGLTARLDEYEEALTAQARRQGLPAIPEVDAGTVLALTPDDLRSLPTAELAAAAWTLGVAALFERDQKARVDLRVAKLRAVLRREAYPLAAEQAAWKFEDKVALAVASCPKLTAIQEELIVAEAYQTRRQGVDRLLADQARRLDALIEVRRFSQ